MLVLYLHTYWEIKQNRPVPEVIILSSPAPECIGKAIDLEELFNSKSTYSTKKLIIGKAENTHKHLTVIKLKNHNKRSCKTF